MGESIRWGGRGSLVIGLLLGLLAAGCEETTSSDSAQTLPEVPQQITYNYHTTQTRGGVPEWELWGDTAERYPGSPVIQLRGVRMVFYQEGRRESELTALAGEIDEKSRNTVARGQVVVVSETGRTLESEELYWDNQRQLIHNDVFVRFTDGDQILTGYGLETDPDLDNLTLQRQVEGEIPVENEPRKGEEGS